MRKKMIILVGLVVFFSMQLMGAFAAIDKEIVSRRAETAPVLDGKISTEEWGEKMFTIEKTSTTPNSLAGYVPDDFYADVFSRWDDQNLYVGVIVNTKQDHKNDQEPKTIWKEDCLQVDIVPNMMTNANDDWYELGFAANTDFSKKLSWRWLAVEEPYDAAEFIVKREGNQTFYEVAITWSSVLPEGMTLKEGDKIGFCACITMGRNDIFTGIASADSMFTKDPTLAQVMTLGSVESSAGKDEKPEETTAAPTEEPTETTQTEAATITTEATTQATTAPQTTAATAAEAEDGAGSSNIGTIAIIVGLLILVVCIVAVLLSKKKAK